jgi:hypothetical protein
MITISLRSLGNPTMGRVNYAGWIDPQGNVYPVNDMTHAEWMLEHYDWLLKKGYNLPKAESIRADIKRGMGETPAFELVKQNWVRIHTPSFYVLFDINRSGNLIRDAILTREINIRSNDYPINITELRRNQQFTFDEEEIKDKGIEAHLKMKTVESQLSSRHEEYYVNATQGTRVDKGNGQPIVYFDLYDLLRNEEIANSFKIALVENGMHMESNGLYVKNLNDPDFGAQYQDVVKKVVHAFKQIHKKNFVMANFEPIQGRKDKTLIILTEFKAA